MFSWVYVFMCVCALGDGRGSRASVLIAGERETMDAENWVMYEDG